MAISSMCPTRQTDYFMCVEEPTDILTQHKLLELAQWHPHYAIDSIRKHGHVNISSLETKIVKNLEELKKLFLPEKDNSVHFSICEAHQTDTVAGNLKIYVIADAHGSYEQKVAYGCNACEKIIIGPPEIKVIGRPPERAKDFCLIPERMEYYCRNKACGAKIGEKILG